MSAPRPPTEATADESRRCEPLTLAASPVSWGVDFPHATGVPTPKEVLAAMSGLGMRGLELGPLGYMPEDPVPLQRLLAEHAMTAIGTWLLLPLAASEFSTEMRSLTERTARFVRAAGGRLIIAIDLVSGERALTAGDRDRAPHTTPREWDRIVANTQQVVELGQASGLDVAFHPHAGTHIEFEDEIEELLERTSGWPLGLCVDSGHSAYSGVPAVHLIARHADRLRHAHLKDVDSRARAAALERRSGFWSAVREGVFCPIGQGIVDFAAFLAALEDKTTIACATIEQDRDPSRPHSAVADLRKSITVLRALQALRRSSGSGCQSAGE